MITAEYEHFYLVVVYIPNAGSELKRLDYRTQSWDPAFRKHLTLLKNKKHVVVAGDLNVAHQNIDIHDPEKSKNKHSGFTDVERENFDLLLKEGFIDTFRHFYPGVTKYSFWDVKTDSRKTNKGWRIDYFLIDAEGLSAVVNSDILTEITGSDHCPVKLVLDPNFGQSKESSLQPKEQAKDSKPE